ncbi:MAG: YifB family Mg chelatase-like AAA ATPase [Agathobacter sp.]|nr:YifB family Mg chelatase-like AAA ATPase [Agathobacter sp.]
MYSTIKTAVVEGIHTRPVQVEIDISNGMPTFDMVGRLSSEIKEGKERIRTALHSLGIVLPAKRITMNLSPGDLPKSGTGFDLPMAVALLLSLGLVMEEHCQDTIFVGELSLKGDILPVKGVLPIIADGVAQGVKRYIIPWDNMGEGRLVSDAKVYGFSDLRQVIAFLNGGNYQENNTDSPLYNIEEMPSENTLDFADVNGQSFLKRACEVAVCGMHNMLMVGPPGAGKTMIAQRVSTILPPLSVEEQLELSKIYSVSGLLGKEQGYITQRPFRAPHHTITRTGLTGGGRVPKPGEISLAHNGVLFLDELTEYQKSTLEILRQPLEDRCIRLVRLEGDITYPANFLLLASMNPCNCGYYPNMQKCRCTHKSLRRYFDRVSQPLLDRIDICVEAQALRYGELVSTKKAETSADIQARVLKCFEIQRLRYANENFIHNSQIPVAKLKTYCALGEKEQRFMENVYEKMELTGRTYHKILRVARTIADMEESPDIQLRHLNEAICYRSIEGKYWGGDL